MLFDYFFLSINLINLAITIRAIQVKRQVNENIFVRDVPIFCCSSTIPLPPVLEPITNLRRREARRRGEFPLLPGIRIRILEVPLSQQRSGSLLEAMSLLFPIPDRPR